MIINTAQMRRDTAPGQRRGWRLAASLLVGLSVLGMAATASAATRTLQDLDYDMLPGGKVALSLKFDGAPPAPRAFTTNDPPRIALDFADTSNGLSKRHIDINQGATEGVSVVSAGGRTRVVVDLLRQSVYRTDVRGDTLVVTVGNGENTASTAGAYAATDPTKVAPASGPAVTDIDFRRGANGGGNVVVSFAAPGANANMHREGNRVVVDLNNVQLPASLEQHLDVNDFATPVSFIDTRATPGGATMNIAAGGDFTVSAYQTPTEYVIDVAPQQKVAATDEKKPELGPDGLPKPVYSGEPATFDFQNIPVRQVLHLIATESDMNIVVADSVQGNVTLRLDNVPWDQALDIVLRAKGLDKRQSGNVLWVAPQAEIAAREEAIAKAQEARQQNAPLISAYIPISYGKAEAIAELLTSKSKQSQGGGAAAAGESRGFLSPRGSVSFDQRTNILLVHDTAPRVREIRNLVAVLDKPVQQVMIESRIVIATDDFARELGIRFGVSGGYEDGNGNVITTSGSLSGAAGMVGDVYANRVAGRPAFPVSPPNVGDRLNVNLPAATTQAGTLGLAILGADYLLDLELSAGQTEGKSEVISSPRVITANQQEADIKQGQEVPYVTYQTSSAGGGLGQSQSNATVAFKDAVLELKVTPTITADDRVFLKLNVKKDAVAGYTTPPGGGAIPTIDTRQISTSVLVDNGGTVVLGGIYEYQKSDNVTKVPVLGDIPVLGALFRDKGTANKRAELLIFVTPRILSDNLK
ncbi:MAG TPA: type IV pilus secretin PilQ [Rhodanobacteraceae bacterium]|nr:type IV pilus secretin PilQ [Rhodanobacteraceae bacterium]